MSFAFQHNLWSEQGTDTKCHSPTQQRNWAALECCGNSSSTAISERRVIQGERCSDNIRFVTVCIAMRNSEIMQPQEYEWLPFNTFLSIRQWSLNNCEVCVTCTAMWSPHVRPAILHSAHTVYLCVLCGSENKQRLFPYTALTGWFV